MRPHMLFQTLRIRNYPDLEAGLELIDYRFDGPEFINCNDSPGKNESVSVC